MSLDNNSDYEYVVRKLQSGIFNFSVIAPMIGVSRKTLSKIAYGKSESPQQLTIDVIAEFFRGVGA
jgi:hypothetical protein